MSWGKVIGGVIGAAMGGPVGAGIGVLLGAGFEDSDGNGSEDGSSAPNAIGSGSLALAQSGNVLRVTATLPARVNVDVIAVRLKQGEAFLKSHVEHFRDDDGDFVLGREVTSRTVSLDVPLHVLSINRTQASTVEVVVVALKDEEYVGHLIATAQVRVGFEPWSNIGWLAPAVDLLALYALRSGPWTGEKIRLIKSVFSEFLELDGDESGALRDRLKLTVRPTVEESVSAYLRRFDAEALSVSILAGIAGLLRLSGCAESVIGSELDALGRRMQVSPEMIQEAKGQATGQSSSRGSQSNGGDVGWACQVLGVQMGASPEAIQQAWRKKVSELHPDKYASLPEVVQNLVKEKTQDINRARDILAR
ncbi:MAG: DnaJ domain-containing protein [Stagnimonas sp.]|nr:DnaJ domain-containing protein [Stagnimonas sp.]